jgi:hypothetical protein
MMLLRSAALVVVVILIAVSKRLIVECKWYVVKGTFSWKDVCFMCWMWRVAA